VLVLLPPSETKASGGTGPSLRTAGLGPPLLAAARGPLLEAVARFCRDDPAAATAALKLPAGSAATALAVNTTMLDAPTMPAIERFTGVLYEALDATTLTESQRARAAGTVVIMDGAFGAVRADELLPDHRVPASATVPGVGSVTAWWRPALRGYLPLLLGHGPVLDLRSTDYAAMWPVTGPLRRQVVPVRVLVERGRGRARVLRAISHPAKVGKGRLARALLTAPVLPGAGEGITFAHAVSDLAEGLGFRVEVRRGAADQVALDLISREPAARRR